jgi:hypothetical protein
MYDVHIIEPCSARTARLCAFTHDVLIFIFHFTLLTPHRHHVFFQLQRQLEEQLFDALHATVEGQYYLL